MRHFEDKRACTAHESSYSIKTIRWFMYIFFEPVLFYLHFKWILFYLPFFKPLCPTLVLNLCLFIISAAESEFIKIVCLAISTSYLHLIKWMKYKNERYKWMSKATKSISFILNVIYNVYMHMQTQSYCFSKLRLRLQDSRQSTGEQH